MKRFKRVFLAHAMALLLMSASAFGVQAATKLYEQRTSSVITKGVDYELVRRVTDEGLLDIHIMTVDLTQNHIDVKPISSKRENGLKETMTDLVRSHEAIAAINGDFFGMAGTHSAPLGLQIADGNIFSMSDALNEHASEYATFLLDNEGNPLMQYIRTQVSFWSNGRQSFDLYAINVLTDMTLPIYIDRNAYANTAQLDARTGNLSKIVVQDGVITYISQKGEVVDVPENGFVIVMDENIANQVLHEFKVGDSGSLATYVSGLDVNNIQSAISGGSKIISEGLYTESGHFIKGRQPRTVLGLNQANDQLIMMVVDGRTHSIGATHGELAGLLLEYGVHNAMHLDGGGSSTMVFKEPTESSVSIRNTLSDGAQRRIINGLGIFNNSTPSELHTLQIELASDFVFKGAPVKVSVRGFDEFYNEVPVDEYELIPSSGYMLDGYYYPEEIGMAQLYATVGSMITEKDIEVLQLAQINSNVNEILLPEGGEHIFQLTGVAMDGRSARMDHTAATYEIAPYDLGVFEDGKLIVKQSGIGYVKITAGGVERYIKVSAGTNDTPITAFAGLGKAFSAYPNTVAGSVAESNLGAALSYRFLVSSATQAAYLNFTPISIPGNPIGLKVTVHGDNSNQWLRGRVVDANGAQHLIDFTRNIDFEGSKTLSASLPQNITHPVSIDRLYVAALSVEQEVERTLYFSDLTVQYALDHTSLQLPASTQFRDHLNVDLTGAPAQDFFDATFVGNIVLPVEKRTSSYQAIQNNALQAFRNPARFGWFIGDTDNIAANMAVYKTSPVYAAYTLEGISFIQMTLQNGSLYASDPNQWRNISAQLLASQKNIVILFDKNPLTASPQKEFELFHSLLAEMSDKNIFVISNEGNIAATHIKDAVRYINIPNLFLEDGSVNPNFKSLRLRFGADRIQFQLQ